MLRTVVLEFSRKNGRKYKLLKTEAKFFKDDKELTEFAENTIRDLKGRYPNCNVERTSDNPIDNCVRTTLICENTQIEIMVYKNKEQKTE